MIKIIDMKTELKNSVIYQVYTRNYTKEGTFSSLIKKLDYIKSLNTDILYLLPINEIGVEGRKGDLGSPYSIKDYLKINPELGSLEDFISLINETHNKGMKIMIDIVFNHTSRDSKILNEHPNWMYKDKGGNFANKCGDWSDVYDLDYSNDDLIHYLVYEVIHFYSSIGVDGYRFDVASLIPSKFFIELKKMLDKEFPNTILLAESIHTSFNTYVRSLGFNALSDAELFMDGFDLLYCYNTFEPIQNYLKTRKSTYLDQYKLLLASDEAITPSFALRIRGLENHDQPRLIEYTKNERLLRNLAAYPVFMKGPMFIYNGLETKADHNLSLFTKDLMDDSIDQEWFDFIKKLTEFKKEKRNLDIRVSDCLQTKGNNLVIKNTYNDDSISYGLFSFSLSPNGVLIKNEHLENGTYVDYLTNKLIFIKNHSIKVKEPLFLIKKD